MWEMDDLDLNIIDQNLANILNFNVVLEKKLRERLKDLDAKIK